MFITYLRSSSTLNWESTRDGHGHLCRFVPNIDVIGDLDFSNMFRKEVNKWLCNYLSSSRQAQSISVNSQFVLYDRASRKLFFRSRPNFHLNISLITDFYTYNLWGYPFRIVDNLSSKVIDLFSQSRHWEPITCK